MSLRPPEALIPAAGWRSGLPVSCLPGEVGVEPGEKLSRRVVCVDQHTLRCLEERLGVVEDHLHARRGEIVGRSLCGLGRAGQDSSDDRLRADDLLHLSVVAHDRGAEGLSDAVVVELEDGRDLAAVVAKEGRVGERLAEPAAADERDLVLPAGSD